MKAAEQEQRAEQAHQQCNALPSDKKQLAAPIDSAWFRKKAAINDGINTLRKFRSDLENDSKWTIGDPGSARELTTYLAQVTKTTTNLLENLGGFSSEKSTRAAKEVYEKIKQGRTAYEAVTQDAKKIVINVLLDAASDAKSNVNVIAKAVKTIKDFAENMTEMAKTPEELKTAREEVKRQLENIDAQISNLQSKIEQTRREHEPDQIESLLQTYQSVREFCAASSPSVSRP
jgi:archaellum component FlaC